MENKENILTRVFNKIKAGWTRLGEPDINNAMLGDLDAATAKEVKAIQEVQEKVHEQRGFVPRAKVNEGKAQATAKGKGRTNTMGQKILGDA